MRHAAHPHAAVLFCDFMPIDARLLLGRDYVPTNKTVDTPLNKAPLREIARAGNLFPLLLHKIQCFDFIFQKNVIRCGVGCCIAIDQRIDAQQPGCTETDFDAGYRRRPETRLETC